MTEWNVYTVGDIEFMHNVFNAIAMLMNSGMFSDLFRIAALLGVIGIVISSAISAGKTVSFQNMAVCIVMYMLFFQVSARVNIEDVTSGRFRAVDNVPAGLAASASIISTVGYSITEKMEQAFSTPSMTEYGALDPLVALSTYYDSMKNPMRWFMANEKPRVDFARSIQNYMKTCVMNDIARGAKTYSTLYRSTEGVQALRSQDAFQRVVLFDGQMVGWDPSTPDMKDTSSQYTCAEAYDKLNMMYSSSTKMLTAAFQRSYNALGRECLPGKACTQNSKVQEIMNFYNISGTTMRDFQMTMIMYPYLRDVPKYGYEAAFRGAAAVTRTQTQTQQAFQWASSGASFLSWMAAFMPIFQGLIYALTPFMAFLFGLGIMGVRLVMKYFLVIIWTQTWMPLAAIVNMYILVHTQNNLSVIFSDPGQVSFDKLYIMLYETQKSIGLAGNLYAMIPALGGFIVWGSSVAFNSLANSAAAPHAADTKQMAPDLSNAPAISNRGADVNYDRASGTVMGGASSALPKFDMKQAASSNLASAKQNVESASKEVQAARGQMFQDVASNMQSGSHSQAYSNAMSAGLNSLSSTDRAAVQDYAKRNNMSESQALTTIQQGAIQGSLNASVGAEFFGGTGVKAQGNASLSRNETANQGKTNSSDAGYSSSESTRNSESASSQLSRIRSQSAEAVYNSLQSSGQSTASTSQYGEAYKKQETAQKSYSEAQQYSMSTSMGQSMNAAQLSQAIGNNAGAQAALTQTLAGRDELNQRVNEDTARLSALGMTQEDAHTFAQFNAAVSIGQAGEIAKLAGFVSGGSGQPELSSHSAQQNQGIAAGAKEADAQMGAISHGVSGGAASTRGQASSGISSAQSESSQGTAMHNVLDAHDGNQTVVHNRSNWNSQEINTQQGNAARSELVNKGNYHMTGSFANTVQEGLDLISNVTQPGSIPHSEGYTQAREVADQVGGVGGSRGEFAKESISNLYASVKSGQSDEQLESARIAVFQSVSLATGGEVVNGKIEGGDQQLAMAIVGKIDSTKSDLQRNDSHVVRETVTSLMSDHNKN